MPVDDSFERALSAVDSSRTMARVSKLFSPTQVLLQYSGTINRGHGPIFFFQAEDGIRDAHVTGVQSVLFRSGRPSRQDGIRRWVGELQTLASVQFAAPQCAIAIGNIGYPLTIFGESHVFRGDAAEIGRELFGL